MPKMCAQYPTNLIRFEGIDEGNLAARTPHPQTLAADRHLHELPTALEVQRAEVVRGVHIVHIEPQLNNVRR